MKHLKDRANYPEGMTEEEEWQKVMEELEEVIEAFQRETVDRQISEVIDLRQVLISYRDIALAEGERWTVYFKSDNLTNYECGRYKLLTKIDSIIRAIDSTDEKPALMIIDSLINYCINLAYMLCDCNKSKLIFYKKKHDNKMKKYRKKWADR